MLISGGRVCTDDGFIEADVRTDGAYIEGVFLQQACPPKPDESVLDATGCFVCPGLVDLHFHGCMGSDFCDGTDEALSTLARFEASRGITSICPTTMTYPESRLETIMDAAARFEPADDEADIVGINLEGPFISPQKVGAQNPDFVQPCDIEMARRLNERSGNLVKLIDVAPEEPGALEFIREISPSIRISLAHTCADYDCARAAFEAGARQITHLYNAMPGLHHREPGPIAAAALRDDIMVEIIADTVHVHPAMVQLAYRLFGSDRVVLVSDSMRACGLGAGTFDLGGQDVIVEGLVAKLADGTLAGSVTDLATCVQIAVRDMGIDPWVAIRSASTVPARALGLDTLEEGKLGHIQNGYLANVVIFDADMNARDVVLRGTKLCKTGS